VTKALVIGRRRVGRKIGPTVHEVERQLIEAGWTVETAVVYHKRQLRKRAAKAVKDEVDIAVAVGGDGAVFQVVNAIAGSATMLGIIPKGTGNLLAGNLDIPTQVDKAVQVLLEGTPREIDLGRVAIEGADRDFAVACGVGFDANVMDATDPNQKRRWGKLAYVAAAVREGRKIREVTHEITIDGRSTTTAAAQVFIANFGRIGSLAEPRRRVIPDDGRFDVFVVRAGGPVEGVLAGWTALNQRTLGEADNGRVLRRRAREVTVKSKPRQLVETDGTVIGRTPISVSIRPKALRVMAPARSSRAKRDAEKTG
jgi:YegS/Rv2252/BmrU family lipid kinase